MVFTRPLSRAFQRPAASLLATPSRQWRAPALQPVFSGVRTLTASAVRQGKVLMVLYDVSLSGPLCN